MILGKCDICGFDDLFSSLYELSIKKAEDSRSRIHRNIFLCARCLKQINEYIDDMLKWAKEANEEMDSYGMYERMCPICLN